jgi:hypothetical protein
MLEPKCWHWSNRFRRLARIDYHIQHKIVVIALPILVTTYARVVMVGNSANPEPVEQVTLACQSGASGSLQGINTGNTEYRIQGWS